MAAVFIWRSPLAVAQSLQARDRTHLADGVALWERYNRSGLAGLTGVNTFVTRYESIVEDPDIILRKQLDRSQDFISPRQLNPEIPFTLEKAILKCLEREPDNRYPITSVLVHDLKTALYV